MLEFLTDLLEVSIGCGVVIGLLVLLTPVLSKYFSPKWRRCAWLLIAMRMFWINGSWTQELFPAPIQISPPEILIQTDYGGIKGYNRDSAFSQYGNVVSGSSYTQGMNSEYYVKAYEKDGGSWSIQENYWVRTETDTEGVITRTIHYSTVIGVGWGMVAAAIFVTELWRYRRFRKNALRWSVEAGDHDTALLDELKQQLNIKTGVELYRWSSLRSPLLMGFSSPVILLPEDLPDSDIRMTLAHELTHLKHRDPCFLLYLTVARSLHWFNPMAWLMVRQARRDVEECCDYALLEREDLAVRRAYGQTILNRMTADRSLPGITTGFSGDKKSIFSRFRAIMDTRPKGKGRAALLLACFVTVLACGLVACESQSQNEPALETQEVVLGPDGAMLVYGTVLSDLSALEYMAIDWFSASDEDSMTAWLKVHWQNGWSETVTTPLAEDGRIMGRHNGSLYTLDDVTIEFQIKQAQDGVFFELYRNEQGEITQAIFRGNSSSGPLPLSYGIGHYNAYHSAGKQFPASTAVYEQNPYYCFSDPNSGITVLMPPDTKNELGTSIIQYAGHTLKVQFPVNPLSQGNAGGLAGFYSADLTGDNVPELIYIYGWGGTGSWQDACRIFDLASMEELTVDQDISPFLESITVEPVRENAPVKYNVEQQVLCMVTDWNGHISYAFQDLFADLTAADIEPTVSGGSHIYITLEDGALVLSTSFCVKNEYEMIGFNLGTISGKLTYSPQTRAFSVSRPEYIEFDDPVPVQN